MAILVTTPNTIIQTQPLRQLSPSRIFVPPTFLLLPGKPYPDSKVFRCRKTMSEPITIRPEGGDDDGDGRIRALEQEAFFSRSPASTSVAHRLEATLNNLSKWIMAVFFGLFIIWRHDAEALWGASGSVVNAALSTALKRLLNQERPVANLRSDPGMPSSHAQSILYITTWTVLSMVQWWGLNRFTIAIAGTLYTFGLYLSWLRISQKLHTFNQVIVGALIGALFSSLWFWSWGAIVLKAFESHFGVQIVVVLGGVAFCVGFFLYVLRYWILEPVLLYLSRKNMS